MLQVARLAPKLLGESADLVVRFLRDRLNEDGGFQDRSGRSDLYYTVFGIDGLLALRADLPAGTIAGYLRTFADGAGLDFVHLACLARAWASLPAGFCAGVPADAILQRIEAHRTADGGYQSVPASGRGTIYGCFLALGAYQDLHRQMPERLRLLECMQRLRTADGGYANQHDLPLGLTPATAAAATLFRCLDQFVPPALADWLLSRAHPQGGFSASLQAPLPDVLSTATALHALAGMRGDFAGLKEPCLDFLDSLWTNQGSFYGNWTEDTLDCEYTYYALLALGHLSL